MLSASHQAACLGFPVLLTGTRRATRSRPARVGGTFGSNASKHLATWSKVPVRTREWAVQSASSDGPGRAQDTGPGHTAAPPTEAGLGTVYPPCVYGKGPASVDVARKQVSAALCEHRIQT